MNQKVHAGITPQTDGMELDLLRRSGQVNMSKADSFC